MVSGVVAKPTPKPQPAPRIFIPCPACKRAIELAASGKLPEQLVCPSCGTRIRR